LPSPRGIENPGERIDKAAVLLIDAASRPALSFCRSMPRSFCSSARRMIGFENDDADTD
jgi:hypothetical protein